MNWAMQELAHIGSPMQHAGSDKPHLFFNQFGDMTNLLVSIKRMTLDDGVPGVV
jgi:hypothetical protein